MYNNPIYLSVVVPCYNESSVLKEFNERISTACQIYTTQGYEIIFVDDGSSDDTWLIIESYSRINKHIKGISLSRNFGHSMALTAGLDMCQGQRILIIDADLQDPPELLPEMMKALNDGADVAYGKRTFRQGETWFKRISASLFYRILSFLSDTNLPKDTGDFRLLTRRVLNALISMPETSRYTRGMIAWTGFRQVPIKYVRQERFAGETHYTFKKMIDLALNAILSFSIRPLRLAIYLGFIMLLTSICLIIYIIISYFYLQTVHGWASLACILVTLQAVQFLILGIIGEYVGRIYQECKNRPKYIIKEITP